MDNQLSSAERLNQLKNLLDAAGAAYEIFYHQEAILTADDGVASGRASLAETAPTFILETEKGYLAAIIRGDTRLSYKKIKKALGLKNVSLAKPDVVERVTGAQVGSVSLVNPGLVTIIDTQLITMPEIYGGCGVAHHTLRLSPDELIRVMQARVFEFTEPKEETRPAS
jgi:prolyl-tRNA editing enzyme YbaK/EbsC (Cys-tRNA(Pro) deacylase)